MFKYTLAKYVEKLLKEGVKMKSFSEQIGVRLYCIRNQEGDYWCNDWGWIKLEDETDDSPYSVFTEREKEVFALPIGNGVHWEIM